MLAWPHSGFHVHDGVWVVADDRAVLATEVVFGAVETVRSTVSRRPRFDPHIDAESARTEGE